MERYVEVTLTKRAVTARVRLLDDLAPRTCQAIWEALPLSSDVFHGKYARNEVYGLFPQFAAVEPGMENPSITPIPGDLMYWKFEKWQIATQSHGYASGDQPHSGDHCIDIAYFYERNNLLLNPDIGFVPGNVWGTIVEGLDELAAASQDLWRHGAQGEMLRFSAGTR